MDTMRIVEGVREAALLGGADSACVAAYGDEQILAIYKDAYRTAARMGGTKPHCALTAVMVAAFDISRPVYVGGTPERKPARTELSLALGTWCVG